MATFTMMQNGCPLVVRGRVMVDRVAYVQYS